MNIEKIFKNIIIINFLLIISCIIYLIVEESINPSPEVDSFSNIELISLIASLVYIINFYFLFKFKSLGKTLFVPILIIIYALSLGLPETYFNYTPIESAFESINIMLDGMIVAMLYWTDIKKRFE